MSKLRIYLDYAATTPLDPRVFRKMHDCLGSFSLFGNPSSSHYYGHLAENLVQEAQVSLARLIHCDPEEIIWTSGATESINLALKGLTEAYFTKKNHIITLATEHKAVLDTCQYLQKKGMKLSILKPCADGKLDWDLLKKTITPQTLCISLLHVHNETGIIEDIKKIAEFCREQQIFTHIDGAQTLGKIDLNLKDTPVDLMSFSSHKCYGPKGVGALFIRKQPKIRIIPQIHGGGQQNNLRSGTLAPHQIAGFGEACAILTENVKEETSRIRQLRNQLWLGIKGLPGIQLNSDLINGSPHHLHVSIAGIEGESLLFALDQLAVSSGSACTAATIEPSHALLAMGINPKLAYSSIRFSLGRFTTSQEINKAIDHIKLRINWLTELKEKS